MKSTMTRRGSHVLADYITCQQYFKLRHLHGLWPRGLSFDLLYGSAWHSALEAFYWRKALEETKEEGIDNWPFKGEDPLPHSPLEVGIIVGRAALGPMLDDEWLAEKYEMGNSLMESMLTQYEEHWALYDSNDRQFYLEDDPARPAIETPFSYDLGHGYTFTGTLDRILWRHQLVVVQEHKTVRPNGIGFLSIRARMDKQFTAYHIGGESITGRRIDNLELNACPKVADPEFKRIPITRTNAELDAFRLDVDYIMRELDAKVLAWEKGEDPHFVRSGAFNGLCVQYARACPFLSLCKAPDRSVDYFPLDSLFTVETDNIVVNADRLVPQGN